MQNAEIKSRLERYFPSLYDALPELSVSAYRLMQVPANTTIFDVGSPCEQYLLLTKGTVSAKMYSKSGKSILLYRIEPGQSCIITTSCLLGNTNYPTVGETETDCEALGISKPEFTKALNQSALFRKFVFDCMGQRLSDVMLRLETVNFTSIDSRIANALLSRQKDSPRIRLTHESLAEEVGTAREVVSRHLKSLETQNLIKLERGEVILKDTKALAVLCE